MEEIFSKSPLRISFFGGGTDIPEFFNKNKGAVISTTIDKYIYTSINSDLESDTDLISSNIKKFILGNISIHTESDLPRSSGLGQSSSKIISILLPFFRDKSKKDLTELAIFVEQNICGIKCGWQDQISICFGGFNKILFDNGTFNVKPINMDTERKQILNRSLMLFNISNIRDGNKVQEQFINNINNNNELLLNYLDFVDKAEQILESDESLDNFGYLLDDAWQLKRKLYNDSYNKTFDNIYNFAKNSGALGGKFLGAGGSSSLLLYVPINKQKDVLLALKDYEYIPFNFTDKGAEIL